MTIRRPSEVAGQIAGTTAHLLPGVEFPDVDLSLQVLEADQSESIEVWGPVDSVSMVGPQLEDGNAFLGVEYGMRGHKARNSHEAVSLGGPGNLVDGSEVKFHLQELGGDVLGVRE